MNKEKSWQENLIERYPEFFKKAYPCVGEGWSHLLEALCLQIEHYLKYTKKTILPHDSEVDPDENSMYEFYFAQVKEKFGGLRAYYSGGDNFISGVVAMAETMSCYTCEVCGGKGVSRSTNWTSTLCDEHYEERREFEKSKRTNSDFLQLEMWDKNNKRIKRL